MKELSIEEKAKLYDEAKARMSRAFNSNRCTLGFMNEIFPEIKESEDEKIRKELVDFIYDKTDTYELREKSNSWLAWLEKQGEQKFTNNQFTPEQASVLDKHIDKFLEQNSTNKVEPKFKVGDWVVNTITDNVEQIIEVTNNEYICSGTLIVSFDNQHLLKKWTIQDARDGDILCTYECGKPKIVFMLKGAPKKPYVLGYHCYYNIIYPHFEFDSEKGCLAPNDEDVKPATKEQVMLFFQKVEEAGYKWDAEKKELKKIEPKTAAWTPMDEQRVENLLAIIEGHGYPGEVAWLNSLKDRVQPNQEWSEDDEKMYASIIDDTVQENQLDGKQIDWLRNIKYRNFARPQNTWKPSDEQIKVCKEVYAGILSAKGFDLGTVNSELNRLEEQLKNKE